MLESTLNISDGTFAREASGYRLNMDCRRITTQLLRRANKTCTLDVTKIFQSPYGQYIDDVDSSPEVPGGPTVSVVICAFTEKRWQLLLDSVASAQSQTRPPIEVIVSIDSRATLLPRFETYLSGQAPSAVPVRLVVNPFDGEIGSARNAGASVARGDIVVFLDDDAAAANNWLELLIAPYADDTVAAVGGRPIPRFENPRPRWFPLEFDWTFGCAYEGLPTIRGPVAHLIGANLSVRRATLDAVGGFHWNTHDDMDLCHRVALRHGRDSVIYEPAATVSHFVPSSRTTWTYFWRRCFFENRDKVAALHQMADAASLGAETNFVKFALLRALPRYLGESLKGDLYGFVRAAAMLCGIALAGLGNLYGRIEFRFHPRPAAQAHGWPN